MATGSVLRLAGLKNLSIVFLHRTIKYLWEQDNSSLKDQEPAHNAWKLPDDSGYCE